MHDGHGADRAATCSERPAGSDADVRTGGTPTRSRARTRSPRTRPSARSPSPPQSASTATRCPSSTPATAGWGGPSTRTDGRRPTPTVGPATRHQRCSRSTTEFSTSTSMTAWERPFHRCPQATGIRPTEHGRSVSACRATAGTLPISGTPTTRAGCRDTTRRPCCGTRGRGLSHAESDFPEADLGHGTADFTAYAHHAGTTRRTPSRSRPPCQCMIQRVARLHADVGSGLPLLLRRWEARRDQHHQRVGAARAVAVAARAVGSCQSDVRSRQWQRVRQVGVDRSVVMNANIASDAVSERQPARTAWRGPMAQQKPPQHRDRVGARTCERGPRL